MSSQGTEPPSTPAALASAFLGTPPTSAWAPHCGPPPVSIPRHLDPEEHDLSDWFPVGTDPPAPPPSEFLGRARALVETYRAISWIAETWDTSRRSVRARHRPGPTRRCP